MSYAQTQQPLKTMDKTASGSPTPEWYCQAKPTMGPSICLRILKPRMSLHLPNGWTWIMQTPGQLVIKSEAGGGDCSKTCCTLFCGFAWEK